MQRLKASFNKHWDDVYFPPPNVKKWGDCSNDCVCVCGTGNGRDTLKNETFLLTDDCEFS
jgi:hypothetical protein